MPDLNFQVTGVEAAVPADAEDHVTNNRMRGEIDSALSSLKLLSRDDALLMSAVPDMQ